MQMALPREPTSGPSLHLIAKEGTFQLHKCHTIYYVLYDRPVQSFNMRPQRSYAYFGYEPPYHTINITCSPGGLNIRKCVAVISHTTQGHPGGYIYIYIYIRVCKNVSSKNKGRCKDGAVCL